MERSQNWTQNCRRRCDVANVAKLATTDNRRNWRDSKFPIDDPLIQPDNAKHYGSDYAMWYVTLICVNAVKDQESANGVQNE